MSQIAPLSVREKRNLILMFGVCGLFFGAAGLFTWLDADPNIQIPARAAPPNPNGFDLYVGAANLTAQPNPPVDPSSDPNSGSIGAATAAIRYGAARRGVWHRGANPGWRMFRAAQNAQTRDPYAYGALKMPGYARLRELARNKAAETHLYQMRGQNANAVNSALDSVEMGFNCAQGGALISRLVGTACAAIGVASINDADHLPEKLDAKTARAAMTRLQTVIARRPSYAAALEHQRWFILAEFQRAIDDGSWRSFGWPDNAADAQLQPFGERMARLLTSKRAVVRDLNRIVDAQIAAERAPYQPGPLAPPANLDPIAALYWNGARWRFNSARENVALELLLLRLALQTHRAEHGRYPANLSALRGAYLAQIPTDDFSGGKPYRYVIKGDKYRLWSVGPDGRDDGGRAIVAKTPPNSARPWLDHLPSVQLDSTGDVVAGEVR